MRKVAAVTLVTLSVLVTARTARGTEAASRYPFVAYVDLHSYAGHEETCAGALVHRSYVLTEAQCFVHHHAGPEGERHLHGAEQIRNVVIGESRLGDGTRDGEDRGVSEVLFHPRFDEDGCCYRTYPYDLALLRLATPSTKTPIEVPSPASPSDGANWLPERPVSFVGWTFSRWSGVPGPYPDVRRAGVLVRSDAESAEDYDRLPGDVGFDRRIDVAVKRDPDEPCPSDEHGPLRFIDGTPLFVETGVGPKLVGTASKWRPSCERGIFKRIGGNHLYPWIHSVIAETPLVGDVNGDGRDDIVTFTHGARRDVIVAPSTGRSFGAAARWHESFAATGDQVALGDLDGDGREDIWSFSEDAVSFAYSEGHRFSGVVFSQTIPVRGATPVVGDFTGDGRDDLVLAADTGFSWYRSEGAGFRYVSGEVEVGTGGFRGSPALEDVTGDGREDLVLFTQGTDRSRVIVRPSTGTRFGAGTQWHGWFAPAGEMPVVGRMDRDARGDIATFTRGSARDVWVATSTGGAFGASGIWHSTFGRQASRLAVGDVNGDGLDDLVEFTQGTTADVYVAANSGLRSFGAPSLWHGYFAP